MKNQLFLNGRLYTNNILKSVHINSFSFFFYMFILFFFLLAKRVERNCVIEMETNLINMLSYIVL